MNAAVSKAKTDFLANAQKGWGDALPDWVVVLAEQSGLSSATAVAKKLDYSTAVVTSTIGGVYAGDLGKIEAKVRGAFMGYVVACPVLGEIARDYCIQQQGVKSCASAHRTRLFRACRGGCAHSRLKTAEVSHV